MRNTMLFASLLAAMLTVTGCDFFRALVGRPTSEWIAQKEERIKADKEFRESIGEILAEEEDGQTEQDAPESSGPSESNGFELSFKYYVVIGVFASHDNAKALADKAIAKDYECVLVDWYDNKEAVTINPTNDLAVAYSSLEAILKEPFAPKDAWIMDGNRNKI